MESFEGMELFNFLPIFIGFSVSVEGNLINFQQSGLFGASVILSFIVLFNKEGLEVNGDLKVSAFVRNTDRHIKNPFLIKASNGWGKLFNNCLIWGIFFEWLNIKWFVLGSFSNNENWLNFSVVWIRLIVTILSFFNGVFKSSLDILEIESKEQNSIRWLWPAWSQWVSKNNIPVGFNDNIQGIGSLGILFSPWSTNLRVSFFLIWRWSLGSGCIINLDCSLDILCGGSNSDGESIESGESKSWVSASVNGIWNVKRIKCFELDKSNSVPSDFNCSNLDFNFRI